MAKRIGTNPQTGETLVFEDPPFPVGLPPLPQVPPLTLEARLSKGVHARVLDVTVEDAAQGGARAAEGAFGPAATTATVLAALRPGFFGLGEGASRVASAAESASNGAASTTLVVELAPARPELALALVRSLRAFGAMRPGRSVRLIERGLPDGASASVLVARSVDEVKLARPKLPFPLTLHEQGTESGEVQIDLAAALDAAARAALLDLTTAFATLLGYGLLPAPPPFASAAGRLDFAEDTLPDQWTLRVQELVARKEALYPLLEGLAQLHLRWPIQRVEAWL